MSDLRKALEAITYASDDGLEFEHTHPANEGEPECPACWVQHIRQILAAHPEPALPRFVPSESFVVPLEDPNDPSADEQVEAEAEWDPAAALVDEWARLDAANADEAARERVAAVLLAEWLKRAKAGTVASPDEHCLGQADALIAAGLIKGTS